MEYRFINTFEPVVPLYRDVFSRLRERGHRVWSLRSAGSYRKNTGSKVNDQLDEIVQVSNLKNKRIVALLFFIRAPLMLFKGEALNVILTQPPLFYIFAAIVSRFRQRSYVVHVMDMYPDLLAFTGFGGKILAALLARPSLWAYKGAAKVIAIGECMRERLIAKGLEPSKVVVVRNWADSGIKPVPVDKNEFRRKHGLEKNFVIMYSGNMGYAHDIGLLVQTARLLTHIKAIKFVFIGSGVRRYMVEDAIDKDVSNILLLDSEPPEGLPHSLSAGNIHLVSLRVGYEGLIVPSKAYGVLAAGRPIVYLGERMGEIARCIEQHCCGSVLERPTAKQLADLIIDYWKKPSLIEEQGTRARQAAEIFYAPDKSAERYVQVLEAATEVAKQGV